MISFSKLTHSTTIGKHFTQLPDRLDIATIGNITQADIEIVNISTLQELPEILKNITPYQHLCTGVPKPNINRCVHGDVDSFSCNRTNKDLPFPSKGNQALMVIDSDGVNAWPDLLVLGGYACVRTTSSSSRIYLPDGTELRGFRGCHTYYAVKNGKDIPRALLVLHKHQVINLTAVHKISAVGGFLERSCVDQALASPSQPIYVTPFCSGVEQRKIIEYVDGIAIVDTKKLIPDLTDFEEELYQKALIEARIALQPEMLAQRKVWEAEQVVKGISPETVRHALTSERRQLESDFIIHTAEGERTVREICSDSERYHLMNCSDPFEPEYGNKKTVAKIYVDQAQPMIASKAHGGMSYQLIDDLKMYGEFGVEPEPVVISESTELTTEPEHTAIHTIGSLIDNSEWNPAYCNTKNKPFSIIENFQYMLHAYGINVKYDVVAKEMLISGADGAFSTAGDIKDESNYGRLVSLCVLNGLSSAVLASFLPMLMDWNQVNPVADWIHSEPWDGVDRISELFNTITLADNQDRAIAWMMFLKWLKGAVMIVQRQIDSFENVLIVQAEEGGEGKTRWFKKLCPDVWQSVGLMLDPKDKDSVKIGISNWLCELAEIDTIITRSDVKALMAFLSNPEDVIRMPYGRTYSKFARRAAFFGTVNPSTFLKDDSGDRRFWVMAVKSLNHLHNIDMQQLWAQVDELEGVNPWLNDMEHKLVVNANKQFKHVSPIEEQLRIYFSKEPVSPELMEISATEILTNLGIQNPTNHQFKMVTKVAKELGYEKKRISKGNVFTMPYFGV